jgi:hypothetical protein
MNGTTTNGHGLDPNKVRSVHCSPLWCDMANPIKNTFLFTSESVGEGHPDKIWYVPFSLLSAR